MSESPSLRDVAQLAGVSLGTASRAINNKDNVLPETRARVLKAASDLGYMLQVRVSSPVPSKLNTIGVLMKRDPGDYPHVDAFHYVVLCGIEDECKRLGVNLLYSSVKVDEHSHLSEWPTNLPPKQLDGVAIVGAFIEDTLSQLQQELSIPVVLVNSYSPRYDVDSVLIDNFWGAYKAVSYLIEEGHSHIGLIGSTTDPRSHISITERRQGYLRALSDAGIKNTYIQDSLLLDAQAHHATLELLDRNPEVTAIFAVNDDVAQGVFSAANVLGRVVPNDLSIIGFDDTIAAQKSQPPLTTMHVDRLLMGALAVRCLYERAAQPDRTFVTSYLRTKLVVRESVTRPSEKIFNSSNGYVNTPKV